MNGKYIIGGGISGLIYAYYNRDFTIISSDIGGKLNNEFFENIIYLHATDETEEFLKDVGLEFKKKTQLIKYLKDGEVVTNLSVDDKIEFIRKKVNDPNFTPADLNLSTSDYYISVFEIDYKKLLNILTEGLHYIEDKIIKITPTELITMNTRYRYSKLVSTVSANIFWKLYATTEKRSLKSEKITFVLCDKLMPELKDTDFDLCYIIDKSIRIQRVSKRRRDQTQQYLYEFSGFVKKEDAQSHLPERSTILHYYVEADGLIFSDANNIAPQNIVFVGRFATWNHSDKQQDVIRLSKIDFDIQNLWNIQKSFTSNFVDFNTLINTKDREALTKEYFIHLIPELAEVINEINYKQHKAAKVVDRDHLLEELIDVFKYYLNILLMWNVTPDEFLNKFKEKSKKVLSLYNSNK